MGRYCTSSDCIARYNRLSKIDSAQTEIDSHFISFAENELDGLLSPKFTVPFSSNNVTAKDLAIDLTYLRAGNLKFEERNSFKTL